MNPFPADVMLMKSRSGPGTTQDPGLCSLATGLTPSNLWWLEMQFKMKMEGRKEELHGATAVASFSASSLASQTLQPAPIQCSFRCYTVAFPFLCFQLPVKPWLQPVQQMEFLKHFSTEMSSLPLMLRENALLAPVPAFLPKSSPC